LQAVADVEPDGIPALRPYRAALGRLLPGWGPSEDQPEVVVDPALVLAEGVTRLLGHLASDAGCLLALRTCIGLTPTP
jgi:hypothetical protein